MGNQDRQGQESGKMVSLRWLEAAKSMNEGGYGLYPGRSTKIPYFSFPATPLLVNSVEGVKEGGGGYQSLITLKFYNKSPIMANSFNYHMSPHIMS